MDSLEEASNYSDQGSIDDGDNFHLNMAQKLKLQNEETMVNYLNPLTLQAHLFLDALKSSRINCTQMDKVLTVTLLKIMTEIEQFVSKDLTCVVQSDNVNLITPDKFDCIKCIYECKICQSHFGKLKTVCKHLTKGHESQAIKIKTVPQKIKKMKIIQLPSKTASLLNTDFQKFFMDNIEIANQLKFAPEHKVISNDFQKILYDLFPDTSIEVFIFGSRTIGIANHSSDLDIYANIGETFTTFENRGSDMTIEKLRKVRQGLKNSKHLFKNVQSIERARVPILKMIHVPTGIDCDIGFSNALGFCNSTLMTYLLMLQPIARYICIFMKRWMDRSKIWHISSYGITLLTVFFLQMRKDLPPIQQILNDKMKVGPWSSVFQTKPLSFFNMTEQTTNISNWLNIQKEFFEFFSNFDYDKFVICTYLGRPVSKRDLNKHMPESYNQWVKNNPGLEMTKITVQDPIQLNHNISKSIGEKNLRLLITYFDYSAKALEKHNL